MPTYYFLNNDREALQRERFDYVIVSDWNTWLPEWVRSFDLTSYRQVGSVVHRHSSRLPPAWKPNTYTIYAKQ